MKNIKPDKDTLTALSIILLVFLFLSITRTLTSGYHFVDDHEIIKMKSDLKSSSLTKVAASWVKTDLFANGRFRPLYYVHRVIETKILGTDFLLWSVYTALLCSIAMAALFLGTRKLKFSTSESIVFVLITFAGHQTTVLWLLGPQESLGMFFLGLSFFFMTKSFGRNSLHINNLLFILFLILSSLSKESFLIIVPGMIFFRVWYEKNHFSLSLKESVSKNLILLIPLAIVGIELTVIKVWVGTGYMGPDKGILHIILGSLNAGFIFFKTYFISILIVLLFIAWCTLKSRRRFDLFSVIFFILIAVPNFILYSGSGLLERYLLPASMGLGYLVASSLKEIDEKQIRIKKMAIALVMISYIPFLINSFSDALKFSREGRDTNLLLVETALNYSEGNTVMVVVDPVQSYEISVSLKTFLLYEKNIDLYGYALINENEIPENQAYIDGWKSYFKGRQYDDLKSDPRLIIFLDNSLADRFFKELHQYQNHYQRVELGTTKYALFINEDKKSSSSGQ